MGKLQHSVARLAELYLGGQTLRQVGQVMGVGE